MAGLPGGFSSSTRGTYLFPLKGHLSISPSMVFQGYPDEPIHPELKCFTLPAAQAKPFCSGSGPVQGMGWSLGVGGGGGGWGWSWGLHLDSILQPRTLRNQ